MTDSVPSYVFFFLSTLFKRILFRSSMAAKSKNPVWAFLASVQLALLLIALLASTSIIGTVVQQNKPPEHYVQQWGKAPAGIIQTLNLDDMYNSAWFLLLLGAFSLNLLVCSLDRIPTVIRIVGKDNLQTDPQRLFKMKFRQQLPLSRGSAAAAKEQVATYLAAKGWKSKSRGKDGGTLLFAQKGGWTRYGVYVVHVSILIVLLGAIIGSSTVAKNVLKNPQFAFKGGVMLPETRSSDYIFSYDDDSKIPLGFTVRCNFFDIDFYENGMPKDYVSGLTVLDEQGEEILTQTIEVNKPLTYKGITFYQSSYNDMQTPIIKLTDQKTGAKYIFPVDPKNYDVVHKWKWQQGKMEGMLRIQSVRSLHLPGSREGDTELKIWMMDSTGPPSMFTMFYGTPVIVERPMAKYELSIGPHFATGLQVAKDPGVWWVYTGCALMLIGLYVAFFMSHRKIWAYLYEEDGQLAVLFAGNANKNKLGFEKTFSTLANDFNQKS
ncbi:MAG: cytochrome c biogenesis protein ResB [Candidatus Electrothrix sp. AR3]|nr:cytochrome c biogenesis protein ResB [Candidatus Electrothrix sp. AR3]